MQQRLLKRWLPLSLLHLFTAAMLVACGGGSDESDPVAQAEREAAQGLFDHLPVSWVPTKVVLEVGLGTSRSVPVTLTTTKALTNARIVFLPDLRNAVTVSPETIPSLAAGQSATVTLTFAPAANDPKKTIAGVVLLFDRKATISRPLPVVAKLVQPSVVNEGVGVRVSFPPNLIARSSSELIEISRLPSNPESSDPAGRPSLLISFDANPNSLSLAEYYSSRGPGGNLGAISTQVRVGARTGFQYEPPFGLTPDIVVVVPTNGGFIRIADGGSSFFASGLLTGILANVEILR